MSLLSGQRPPIGTNVAARWAPRRGVATFAPAGQDRRDGGGRGARTRGAPGPGAGWTVGRGSGRVVVSATATVVVHGAHYP